MSKALKETYRILKPGGVLTIITPTNEQNNAHWFADLVPQLKEQHDKKSPSMQQLKGMLSHAGFVLKSSHSTMTSCFPEYDFLEGPLHESWRRDNSWWAPCTEKEIEEMVHMVRRMKQDGTLQEYFKDHDKIDTFGAFQILAVQK